MSGVLSHLNVLGFLLREGELPLRQEEVRQGEEWSLHS
jgi:hypothetical protein